MWYNRLSEYLLKEGYINDPVCPCVFIKRSESGFAIMAVYVNDMTLIGTPEEVTKAIEYLNKEFEMKDLGKRKYCLGVGYLSNPHKAHLQMGNVFTYNGIAISWCSIKQTLVTTPSNHSEIHALHEANQECVWLRSVIHDIESTCKLPCTLDASTIINEDNVACIVEVRGGYIKGGRTKHILSKFFYTHEPQQNREIDVKQIRSSDNLENLFTKALPTSTFEKLVYNIGFVPLGFLDKVFNEGVLRLRAVDLLDSQFCAYSSSSSSATGN
ncbi:uncharacterized protein LOC116122991 [Pistacia vera]|uniref:uncharacterized protein LOC116122991 n=1 Tax=Pistacia vera TaxID=55513 RepID=UPI001262B4FB|nr:uncharacterized protein LOC116122991 [Pistacia vera]